MHALTHVPFSGCRFPPICPVVQDQTGWRLINDSEDLSRGTPFALREVDVSYTTKLLGIWAPLARVTSIGFYDDGTLTPSDRAAIRSVVADCLDERGRINSAGAAAIRAGASSAVTLLPWGIVRTIGAATVVAALFVSLGWVRPALRRVTDRRAHRLALGKCPRCSYDLRGLPASRCPECGEEV